MEEGIVGGITTKDLAQMCGVSRTTVNRALSGTGRISPDTKERILRVAREHDYRPDLLARGLVKGRTYYIGVVVLDVKNRYFAQMLSTIGTAANKQGYSINIVLHNNDRQMEQNQLMKLAAYHMDGIILSSVNEGEEYRKFLSTLGMPIVSVDNKIADGLPFVSIDQKKAMQEVTALVLEKGYRKLVFVCPPMDARAKENVYVHEERLKGFQEALHEFPEAEAEYLLDWSYLEKAEQLAKSGARVAFVCTSDGFALDIMKRLESIGKKPPVDYGITGFDNIDTLDYVKPRLSTVSNSVDMVAETAVELLMAMIEQEEDEQRVTCHILPHEIVPGETV
ncbi:sugar-binding domain protein [Marvinbryantia formatexigens DSM 14469]|uniref:Sugar-binding domain protein n=1 Tax=Marvinbryantia formatexigens DSM 14469 TaxID=478749 RepID=C6LAS4_9FIRM|nr:sugar-binding domain protein [Marvinbryantia formatexigens DSM 14469]